MLRRTASRSVTTSCPATRAAPAVGRASVHRMLIVVDLPAPFGPRKPKVSPGRTVKSTPRTASTSPYRFSSPPPSPAGTAEIMGTSHHWANPWSRSYASGVSEPDLLTLIRQLGQVTRRAMALHMAEETWAIEAGFRPGCLGV